MRLQLPLPICAYHAALQRFIFAAAAALQREVCRRMPPAECFAPMLSCRDFTPPQRRRHERRAHDDAAISYLLTPIFAA